MFLWFLPQLVGVEDSKSGVVDDVLMSGGVVVVRLEHEVGGAAVLLAQRDAHVVRQRLALGSHSLGRSGNATYETRTEIDHEFVGGLAVLDWKHSMEFIINAHVLQCVQKFLTFSRYPFSQLYVDESQNPLAS